MKIDIKSGGQRYSVNFKISPGSMRGSTHLIAMAKSSKDLDILDDVISNRDNNDEIIGKIIESIFIIFLSIWIENRSYI